MGEGGAGSRCTTPFEKTNFYFQGYRCAEHDCDICVNCAIKFNVNKDEKKEEEEDVFEKEVSK